MGFYLDYIDRIVQESGRTRGKYWDRLNDDERYETEVFEKLAVLMANAKIVRLLGDQAKVFLNMPIQEGQNYIDWLRLPYEIMYISPDPPFKFEGYAGEIDHDDYAGHDISGKQVRYKSQYSHLDPMVKGIILAQSDKDQFHRLKKSWEYFDSLNAIRVIQVNFLMPIPDFYFNIHTATLAVLPNNTLHYTRVGHLKTRVKIIHWAVHLINFLSSPSIKMVSAQPSEKLQKARKKRGKTPLPGWYEITYRKVIKDYTKDKVSEKRWEHSFRYDVRGHFKRFNVGRMVGRVVWCPPHQRGLKHELYKPKTYKYEQL
jgi:hypothetical protein